MRVETGYLAKKLSSYGGLQEEDFVALEQLQQEPIKLSSGERPFDPKSKDHPAYVLCMGWAFVFKQLPDGARLIIDVRVPGDFLGVDRIMHRASDTYVEAITDLVLRRIRTDDLLQTLQVRKNLGAALLWSASRDSAVNAEHLVDVARRSALERTAHFLLELWQRLRLVGLAEEDGYDCPLSQNVLADVLGLTAIHLNRVLRQLRELDLLIFREGRVTLVDIERLVTLTGFDPTYLDQRLTS